MIAEKPCKQEAGVNHEEARRDSEHIIARHTQGYGDTLTYNQANNLAHAYLALETTLWKTCNTAEHFSKLAAARANELAVIKEKVRKLEYQLEMIEYGGYQR